MRIFDRDLRRELGEHPGYQAIQAIPGVGEIFAAIFVAEIGDVTRFGSPHRLCSWAGPPPATVSRTRRCTGALSPSRDHDWVR